MGKIVLMIILRRSLQVSLFISGLALSTALMSCKKADSMESLPQADLTEIASAKVASVSAVNSVSSNPIITYLDFEKDMGSWYERSAGYAWSAFLHGHTARRGKSALRFELRRHDAKHGYRSEFGQKPSLQKEGWYGFSNFFPASFIKDPVQEAVMQFHAHPDLNKGEAWRSPPVAMIILNDRFILDLRHDSRPVTKGELKLTRIDMGPVAKDVWTDWVFHVKWAWDNTGILEVWKNNKLIISRKNMPNCYNDQTYPYLKIGLYKWEWGWKSTPSVQKRVYFLDELTIGTAAAGYDPVYPGRNR